MLFIKILPSRKLLAGAAAALLALSACSPSLNWREVHSNEARYTVLMPDKPASHSRPVNLGGVQVMMQMTAAEADDLSFAVASATIENATQREAALAFMQQAMVKNIGGSIADQKSVTLKDGSTMTEIHAAGTTPGGRRMALYGRFGLKDERVYQVVAMGPQDKLSGEIAETFLSSFALH